VRVTRLSSPSSFKSESRAAPDVGAQQLGGLLTELIETAQALPFAPAGRRFRQWAAIPPSPPSDEAWDLLTEAHAFAAGG